MPTIYASFVDSASAERAAAALLDHGALAQDISIVANEGNGNVVVESVDSEDTAKKGITTTSAADAGVGAVKGTMAGLGVGILGALAALFVPGIGLVMGGGALAAAVGATAAATAAGTVAGGVAGYLRDQGMGEDMALRYSNAVISGGAILAVSLPSGEMTPEDAEPYFVKYGAVNVSTHNVTRDLMHETPRAVPVVEEVVVPIPVAEPLVATSLTSMATTPVNPMAVAAAVNELDVRPTVIDPVSGAMIEGVAVDPLTGFERPVRNLDGAIVYIDTPVGHALSDVRPTEIDPVTGTISAGTVLDPVTQREIPVRVINGAVVYADFPNRL